MSQSKSARRKRRQSRATGGPIGSLQAYLDAALRAAGETPKRAAARNARLARLNRDHPGRYVAYREVWDGNALVEPFVLVVGDSIAEVEDRLVALPPSARAGAVITRVLAGPMAPHVGLV